MIEEARRSGAKEPSLRVLWDNEKASKLTELPESVSQLTQLRTLILSRNGLASYGRSILWQ